VDDLEKKSPATEVFEGVVCYVRAGWESRILGENKSPRPQSFDFTVTPPSQQFGNSGNGKYRLHLPKLYQNTDYFTLFLSETRVSLRSSLWGGNWQCFIPVRLKKPKNELILQIIPSIFSLDQHPMSSKLMKLYWCSTYNNLSTITACLLRLNVMHYSAPRAYRLNAMFNFKYDTFRSIFRAAMCPSDWNGRKTKR